jgi:DNA polymerase
MKAPAMPHPLLDPRRLALLHGLGLDTAWVPRDALDPAELAALLPAATGVPAQRRADPGHGARGADQPRGAELAPAHAPAPSPTASPTPSPAASRAAPAAASAGRADPARPVAQGSPAPMSEQRLLQVRALDWEPLQALAHDCRACKLGSMRQRAVFGVGHPQARVMVVGEAPGAEEDRQGEPFVGAAGKLLDNMLRACGLSRAGEDPARTVYIANVIKCRPPGNRNPEPDEIAQCLPILQRQIELVRPRLLLALGRFAAQALTGSAEPIGRLRQRAWDWHGTPLVVSYHPAYLLRTPQDKAKAWADLCLAQDLLEGRGA